MNSVAIVTFGIAAAWLVSWVFQLRSASHISAHARAQLGLRPDLVNHRTEAKAERSSQRKLLIGFAISIVAMLMIGPVSLPRRRPGLIARSLNKRSARKRQRALNDALHQLSSGSSTNYMSVER